MNILIIGRGVVGTLYGWALAKAGHSVEYYVRPGRAAAYGPTLALNILDARTKLQGVRVNETLHTPLVEDLPADHNYDLIVVSVQHYRLPEVTNFLVSRLGNATVLMLNNIWTDPHEATATLPADQIIWGFPSAGGGFRDDGVLIGGLLKSVMFGRFGIEAGSKPSARELVVREVLKGSGFGIHEQRDFRGWLWFHFLINVGLLGQGLKAGSMGQMVESDAHLYQAVLNVRELLPVVAARGVDVKLHTAELALFRLPPRLTALLIKLVFKLHAPARSIVQNVVTNEEFWPMARDVLDEARRLGIAVPRLEAFEALLGDNPRPSLVSPSPAVGSASSPF